MFSCNLPPALLAEWSGSFMCYCGNTGWNGYQNKSQHRKLTLEKKILPPLLQGFEPTTFRSRVQRSNHWAIPDPTEVDILQSVKFSQNHALGYKFVVWAWAVQVVLQHPLWLILRSLTHESQCHLYWAIQAGSLTFARHRLSPLAAFTSGAYFLHNGRQWQWICEFYTANFKGIFGGP